MLKQVSVDARPLNHPFSGIGRYTLRLSAALREQGIRLVEHNSNSPKLVELIAVNTSWGFNNAESDLFWSPRHHLPLSLQMTGTPGVVTIHDLAWKHASATMPVLRRTYDEWMMRATVRFASRIICVSRSTAHDLWEEFPDTEDKTDIIELAPTLNPVMDSHGDHPQSADSPYILFVGTNEPRKNLTRVLYAHSRLGDQVPRLTVVSNEGWLSKELQDSCRVNYLTQVTDAQLSRLYEECEFVVAPSLYEGYGLQIAEAAAFGKAVLTSNISALPEVCAEAGLMINPTSTDEIADGMLELAKNRSLREDLERQAIVNNATRSWERVAQKTIRVFETALRS